MLAAVADRRQMLNRCLGMSEHPSSAGALAECLLAVARKQDRSAFGQLFGYFAPRIAAFHVRSGMGAAEAEELAQETMATVWRKAAQFDPAKAGVSTWIFTIARNQRIDMARKSQRALRAADYYPGDNDPEPSVEDLALVIEREEQVRLAVSGLPSEQANVVRLSFFAEKPHAEIAFELGIPLGTVKSRLRLAMARIRNALEDIQ